MYKEAMTLEGNQASCGSHFSSVAQEHGQSGVLRYVERRASHVRKPCFQATDTTQIHTYTQRHPARKATQHPCLMGPARRHRCLQGLLTSGSLLLLLTVSLALPLTQASWLGHDSGSGGAAAGQTPPVVPRDREDITEWFIRTSPLKVLMEIFHQLPPPSAPLEGEYLAELLDTGSDFNNLLSYTGFYNPEITGFWIGKGFPKGEGWGFNLFMVEQQLIRKYKMIVGYNESHWDNKPSYVLDYRAQNHVLGYAQMRDEVRELRPGFFLCMGAWGWTQGRQRQPAPFIMRGPKNPAELEKFKEETGINIREVSLN